MTKDEPLISIVESVINTMTNLITYLLMVYFLQLYAEGRIVKIEGNVQVLSGFTNENGEYQTNVPCERVVSVVSDRGLATYECVDGYAKVITFIPETDADAGKYKVVDSVLMHEHEMKRISSPFSLTYLAY